MYIFGVEFTKERVEKILTEILDGKTLKLVITSGAERLAFFDALDQFPDLAQRFTRMQQVLAEMGAMEVIEIADDESIDYGRAYNKINARKWFAEKILPEKFGQRVDHTVSHRLDLSQVLLEASSRLLPIGAPENTNAPQLPDTPTESPVIEAEFKSVIELKDIHISDNDTLDKAKALLE